MDKYLPIAHAAYDDADKWRPPHDLAEHLCEVGKLAADFASRFGADWARLAGRWHDLGKFRPRFQKYIRQASGFEADAHIKGEAGKAPHSTAGALLAIDRFGAAGRVLAYLIAGHHAGLADWFGGLRERLDDPKSQAELVESLGENPPENLLDAGDFKHNLRTIPGGKDGFALWVRMLFSALVDADFLDTERYMEPDKFASRNAWPTLAALAPLFDAHMGKLAAEADPTPVNKLRTDILRQCRQAALHDAGLFSLTVPTGGGKTLSGMAFALEHARRHGKRRVIHVIPYTSIIEQTAGVFRSIFGNDAVIEHHSNVESDPDKETSATRLACENWDAPIIVTTNVQFFESLFASRTSRCRKLHNIVDSVVILDEAQLLPPEFLQPILDVLNLLTRHYGVTVVLSTATQPALASRQYFDARQNLRGLDHVREIIDDPDTLYAALERVNVRLPDDWHQPTDWPQLAEALTAHESALAIVNTRKDARALWDAMPKGTLHLSALMCGAHRSDVIKDIKKQLTAEPPIPTRVVSTQLVEAGVDVDFPVVYRALAGLDSIAQAAGRCNREGLLKGKGEVVIFVAPKPAPSGLLLQGENACRDVLRDVTDSPLARARFAQYFERLYYGCQLDKAGICDDLFMAGGHLDGRELAVNFRTASEKFRLIDDEDSLPIVVRYRGKDGQNAEIDQWLAMLRRDGPKRWLMHKLQRYIVNLRRRQALLLLERGDVEEILSGLYAQAGDGLYDEVLGLLPEGRAWKPEDFVLT